MTVIEKVKCSKVNRLSGIYAVCLNEDLNLEIRKWCG